MTTQDIAEQAAKILIERHSLSQSEEESAITAYVWGMEVLPVEQSLIEFAQVVIELSQRGVAEDTGVKEIAWDSIRAVT